MVNEIVTAGIIHSKPIVTPDFSQTYPFSISPGNETISREQPEVTIICVIHDCHNGGKLVINSTLFPTDEPTFEAGECLLNANVSSNDRHLGIHIVNVTLSLDYVCQLMNATDRCVAKPIPMFCRARGKQTDTSYIHVRDCDTRTPSEMQNSPSAVPAPRNSSVTVNLLDRYVLLLLVVTIAFVSGH